MNPKELKYSKEHEWVKVEGDTAIVGITDFAQKQLTDIVFIELPEKGKHATASTPMAVIESVKSVSDVFAPVSGEIIDGNTKTSKVCRSFRTSVLHPVKNTDLPSHLFDTSALRVALSGPSPTKTSLKFDLPPHAICANASTNL